MVLAAVAISAVQASAAPTGHFERTLKVSGQVDMELNSGSGNINVHTGSNDTVQISAKIHGNNNGTSWLFGSGDVEEKIKKIEQNPPIQQQGNMIVVGRVEDRELVRNISIDYDVTIPAQTKLTIANRLRRPDDQRNPTVAYRKNRIGKHNAGQHRRGRACTFRFRRSQN